MYVQGVKGASESSLGPWERLPGGGGPCQASWRLVCARHDMCLMLAGSCGRFHLPGVQSGVGGGGICGLGSITKAWCAKLRTRNLLQSWGGRWRSPQGRGPKRTRRGAQW